MFEYVVPGAGGGGYCLAAERFLLAVSDGLQTRIPRLWPLLRDPDARFEDVFETVAGREVSAAPAFAIAEIVDEASRTVRALVHGDAVAEAHGIPRGPISGAGLATWRDSTWHDVEGVMLGLGSVRGGVETLPITGGVVRADWIRWRPAPSSSSAPLRVVPGVRVDDGPLLGLELALVLGRRPEAGLTDAGAPTVPVVVRSPRRLVSAAHLLVERDGEDVLLRDLGTKNGSLLRLPDGSRQLLRDGASQSVPVGTLIELGDDALLEIVAQPSTEH